jgi:outer membrane protein
MTRILLFVSLFLSLPAWAQANIAVVDFQKASQAVKEGKEIQAQLMTMQQGQQKRLADMETQFKGMVEEFQKQEMILSEDAKRDKQRELQLAQQELQQAAMAAQNEFGKAYEAKAGALFKKLKTVCEGIGSEQGYTLILEVSQGGVVYAGSAVDITDELIKRYDAGG